MECIEFWFEFASTYSYPAAHRIEALARTAGKRVVYQPFLLGPLFQEQGLSDSPFSVFPLKGRYMWRDLERLCAGDGLPFQRPTTFPRNGLTAARIALLGSEQPWLGEFVRRVYSANFAADRDISSEAVLRELLAELGLPAELLEQAKQPETKQRMREQTDRARSLGIFGAPSFVVAGELFWGNDRLEQALAWPATGR